MNFTKRILFVGIPDMAYVCLDGLLAAGVNIVGVMGPKKSHNTYAQFKNFVLSRNMNFIEWESLKAPEFLEYLNTNRIHTTVRQVIVPTLNDSEENIIKLKEIILDYPCIDKTELLPFRKICQTKYDSMNLPFPLAHIPEPNSAEMAKLNEILIK